MKLITPDRLPPPVPASPPAAPMETPSTDSSIPSNYEPLTLPSCYAVYPFDVIHVRSYTLADIGKLGHMRKKDDHVGFLEVLSGTILEKGTFEQLTEDDTTYLMYWLRLTSYSKAPLLIKTTCEGKDHPEDAPKDFEFIVHTSDIETDTLDDSRVEALNSFLTEVKDNTNLTLHPPTMGDIMQIERMGEKKIGEDELLYSWATHLNASIHGSLKERVELLRKVTSVDLLAYLQKFKDLIGHGVKEMVTVTCPECKATAQRRVELARLDFFPGI